MVLDQATALPLQYLNFWTRAHLLFCASSLDQKLYTIAVFLDLSKAFDTVNKNIMLLKLERLGFRGRMNEWFDSYLSDRDMYVQINDCSSQVKCINIGFPQGAVNSSWLFSFRKTKLYSFCR